MIYKYKYRLLGGHVHIDVFAGTNPKALGKCGTLIMRVDEWKIFCAAQDASRLSIGEAAGFQILFVDVTNLPRITGILSALDI